jgi:hypothetical protein
VPHARAIFAEILGGAPLVTPSRARNLQNAELRPLIDRFYRGSAGDPHDRVKGGDGGAGVAVRTRRPAPARGAPASARQRSLHSPHRKPVAEGCGASGLAGRPSGGTVSL